MLQIQATKKHELAPKDTTLWVNAFNAEHGRTYSHLCGLDPSAGFGSGEGVVGGVYKQGWGENVSSTDKSDSTWNRT